MISIEGKNIGGLEGPFEFTFDKGLSIVTAPNGTGKSSLLRAFQLIVANKSLTEAELSTCLTDKQINGFVKLNVDDEEFEVQIQRKKEKVVITYSNVDGEYFNFPADQLEFLSAKSELYQGIINNSDISISSWFYNATEAHKFELFLEIATNVLSDYKTTRDKLKKKVSKDISTNQDKINTLDEEINELKQEKDNIEKSPAYQEALNKHQDKKDEMDKLESVIKKLKNKKLTTRKNLDNNEDALRKITREQEDILKKIEFQKDNEKSISAKIEGLVNKQDDIRLKKNNISIERKDILDQIKQINIQLKDDEQLLDRETCPTCHQTIDRNHYKKVVESQKKELKSLDQKKRKMLEIENKYSTELKNIDFEIKDLKSSINESLETLNKKRVQNENKISEFETKLPRQRKGLSDTINDIANKEEKLLDIKKSLKDLPGQGKINSLERKRLDKESLMAELETELESSSEFHSKYKKMVNWVKKAELIHDFYSDAFQTLTNETFTQINDDLLDSFELLQLAKLKKIEFSKKGANLKLEIQRSNNVYTTLDKLSGAEKSLITLIITWVVKHKVLPNEPLFLIDEVTTEMDDTRFQDILDYISKKTDYVIVARHKPLKDSVEKLSQTHILAEF